VGGASAFPLPSTAPYLGVRVPSSLLRSIVFSPTSLTLTTFASMVARCYHRPGQGRRRELPRFGSVRMQAWLIDSVTFARQRHAHTARKVDLLTHVHIQRTWLQCMCALTGSQWKWK